ncbi:hypothetical protein AQUCO_01400595v1 [Aquilegia coerulea]|uniref:Trichome birefringence-like N-terminal domain-containing protein n=1 Tax=Aquilegia coerulea TaxID=218851 RepID=A0A2G5DXB2_AQUCA|nr:hypothetical protein AQUCO_01400595v1 [Aquilegia coerulea]
MRALNPDQISKTIYALAHAEYDCSRAVGRPPSTEEDCPYLVNQVTCQRNKRPDSLYQIWRWESNGCTLRRCVITYYSQPMGMKNIAIFDIGYYNRNYG